MTSPSLWELSRTRNIQRLDWTSASSIASGEVHRIPYMGVGFVAGRIDPLVIDLGAHQTHVFYVPAEQKLLREIWPSSMRTRSQELLE